MADNRQWLDVGLAVLAASGADALTIDRLAREVGLSKGSFYHHFGGMAGYRTALLAHYQATFTTQYIDAVEHGAGAPAREELQRLMDLVCADDDHGSGPTTSAGLLEELTGDRSHAELLARLVYLVTVGAAQVRPPAPPKELRRLYELTLRLAGP